MLWSRLLRSLGVLHHVSTIRVSSCYSGPMGADTSQQLGKKQIISCSQISLWKDSPMQPTTKYWKFPAVFALSLFLLPVVTPAQRYTQTNLVSNVPGRAPVTDPNLQNAWGLVASPTSPWWVSNNAGGTATLYSSATTPTTVVPLVVTIPNAPSQPAPGSPTGVMFQWNVY
jgi:hypothetical protein